MEKEMIGEQLATMETTKKEKEKDAERGALQAQQVAPLDHN